MSLPPIARFLDPRPSGEAQLQGILGAVNIPLAELPGRMHELPARHAKVMVVGPEPYLSQAVAFLSSNGRRAEVAEDWAYGPPYQGRLWEPNEFLIEVASKLKPGSALELACGTGRDAVAMAAAGWEVVAVDDLPDALDRGRDLARRYLLGSATGRAVEGGVGPPHSITGTTPIQWRQINLESNSDELDDHLKSADLVSMAWYLNRDLIERATKLMKPGGNLVVETFTSVHRERFGKPRTEEFVLQPREILDLAADMRLGYHDEDWHGDRHSARLWGIK